MGDSVVSGGGWLLALDLDGVLYRGDRLLPGAPEAVAEGRRRGMAIRFVTNNSTLHRADVAGKLGGMGVEAAEDEVLTSGAAAARWLQGRLTGGSSVLVLGEEGLMAEMEAAGFRPVHAGSREAADSGAADTGAAGSGAADSGAADGRKPGRWAAVVVGLDRHFSFDALAVAQQAVRNGALYVATNADATYPVEHRMLPGAGAIVAALSAAAESEPVVVGKPQPELAGILADTTGVPAERTIMVGDRLETDIRMGADAGMHTVLVLTGVSDRGALERSDVAPDRVIDTLDELPGVLESIQAGRQQTA